MKTFEIKLGDNTYNVVANNDQPIVDAFIARIKLYNTFILRECGLSKDWVINIAELPHTIFAITKHKTREIVINVTTLYLASISMLREIILHEIAHALLPITEQHSQLWIDTAKSIGCSGEINKKFKLMKKINDSQYQITF